MSLRDFLTKIDRGYENGIATSNMAMGLIVSVLGLIALNVESGWLQIAIGGAAALTLLVFLWRMILSFRSQSAAADRRRPRNG